MHKQTYIQDTAHIPIAMVWKLIGEAVIICIELYTNGGHRFFIMINDEVIISKPCICIQTKNMTINSLNYRYSFFSPIDMFLRKLLANSFH